MRHEVKYMTSSVDSGTSVLSGNQVYKKEHSKKGDTPRTSGVKIFGKFDHLESILYN